MPTGWEGSVDLDRNDPSCDTFFACEAAYYASTDPGIATITQTETEVNGAITQYR